jgi:hydrogenase nickel incorporation protein HypA/HybF
MPAPAEKRTIPFVHELSVAESLVEIACEKAHELGDVRVEALHVRLGPLSGVVKEALLFSFEVASQGTPIEGARLAIQDMPLLAYCPSCREVRELKSPQRRICPVCEQPTPELRGGEELQLAALEVWENAAPHR